MMHLPLILVAVVVAVVARWCVPVSTAQNWKTRWNLVLAGFVVPPLFLLMTAIAVVTMGQSSGHHWWEPWCSYGLSVGFVAIALLFWGQLVWQAWRMRQSLHRLPVQAINATNCELDGEPVWGRVMETPVVFSAQAGWWSSELVISRGLLAHLEGEHLDAVVAHELGHAHYRDTFWFFWLGGLKRLTQWLPKTELLWQELMLLREVRADQWAAKHVDSLVLAESLMSVVTAPLMASEAICAGFSCAAPRSRLAQRVDALLTEAEDAEPQLWLVWWQWLALAIALSPLVTIPFHY